MDARNVTIPITIPGIAARGQTPHLLEQGILFADEGFKHVLSEEPTIVSERPA